MRIAACALDGGDETVTTINVSLSYGSESAFNCRLQARTGRLARLLLGGTWAAHVRTALIAKWAARVSFFQTA